MLALLSALYFISFSAIFALADRNHECGSTPHDQETTAGAMKLARLARNPEFTAAKAPTGPIQVHWHVITSGPAVEQGNVPTKHITDGIAAMNHAYAGGNIQFKLVNVTRWRSSRWFNALKDSPDQMEMKTRLRVGGPATLNVYTTNIPGLFGHATFPYNYEDAPKRDGAVVLYSTLPGGSRTGSNFGITLIHEVGHWVGLFHTFQGGCAAPGDYVADTPASASPSTSCDLARDSCPGAGNDPVRNFMDYSPHTCKTHFTPGQFARAKEQIRAFRGIVV